MKWTRNYPLREGHYWYRAQRGDAPESIHVKQIGAMLQAQPSGLPAPVKVKLLDGEWSDEPVGRDTEHDFGRLKRLNS